MIIITETLYNYVHVSNRYLNCKIRSFNKL